MRTPPGTIGGSRKISCFIIVIQLLWNDGHTGMCSEIRKQLKSHDMAMLNIIFYDTCTNVCSIMAHTQLWHIYLFKIIFLRKWNIVFCSSSVEEKSWGTVITAASALPLSACENFKVETDERWQPLAVLLLQLPCTPPNISFINSSKI